MSKELKTIVQYEIHIRQVAGKVKVTYKKGFLASIEGLEHIAVKKGSQPFVFPLVAWNLADFKKSLSCLHAAVKIKEVRVPAVNQKIAMWCRVFKEEMGYAYKIKQKEINLMRGLTVNEELLKAYFGHKAYPIEFKKVANYSEHFNYVVGLVQGKVEVKKKKEKYPDDWSKQIESRYQGEELQNYWTFLRSKGWERITTDSGVRKWTRKVEKEEKV